MSDLTASSGTNVPDAPPSARWGLLDAIGSLLGFVVFSFAAGAALVALDVDPIAATGLGTLLGWISLAGWPLLAARRRGNGPRVDLGLAFRPIDLGIGLLGAIAVVVAAYVFVIVYVQLTGDVPTSALGETAQRTDARWQTLVLIGMALSAPFVEELHFRGMWWSVLRRKGVPPAITLVATSLLFAVVHIEPQRAVLLFAAGLAAGFVRMRTGRLGPAFVTHFLINGLAAVTLFLQL